MYRKLENSTLNERLKVIPTAKLLTKSSDSINRSKIVQSPKVNPKVRSGFAKSLSGHFGTSEPTRNADAHGYMTRSLSIASIFRVPQRERERETRRGEGKRGKRGKAEDESRDVRTGEAKTSAKRSSNTTNADEKGESNAGRLTTIFNRIGSIRLRNRSINFESISIDISDKTNGKDESDNRGNYNDEQNRGTVQDPQVSKCQDARSKKLDLQKSSKLRETNFSYDDEEFKDPFASDDEPEVKSWQSDPVKSASQRTLTLWRSFSRRKKRQRKNKELISESLDLDDRRIRSSVVGSGCEDVLMELQLESDLRYLKLDSDFATRRQEDYGAALDRLYKFNMAHGYLAEAAFALCAHAQLYVSGTENRLERSEEKTIRRQNELLSGAVDLFDRAKMWEDAIAAGDVLAKTYKSKFMYVELSDVLQRQARFYRSILQQSSCEPRYLAVEFLGHVLPGFLRGKTFVVRTAGISIETFQFQRNIQEAFHLNGFSDKNVDSTDIRSLSGHFKVMTLKPMPDLDFLCMSSSSSSRRTIPVVVEHYHRHNNVNRFEIVSTDEEQGAILVTESKLPGISRWSLAEKMIK